MIERNSFRLQKRHEVVHEFARCNFGEEMGSSVFDTGICELKYLLV
jgi:hypothetical protein